MANKKRAKTKEHTKTKRSQLFNTTQTMASSTPAEIAYDNTRSGRPMVAVPTYTPAAGAPSMFSNAHNMQITGGLFNTAPIISIGNGPSLDVMHKRVAPNAILNAGGRADQVRCYPGTREAVIYRIEKWGDVQDGLTPPILWLSGPAGAGKSAIVQTVAERRKSSGRPQANFFFFRGDPSRSHAFPLIATLLHQIILCYPSLRNLVAAVLSDNPLLFDSVLEEQLEQLIITPLLSILPSSTTHSPLLLLIDGLDECESQTKDGQTQIIRAFDNVSRNYSRVACPFRVLVASRDEPQIQMALNGICTQCLRIYLDDQYSPEDDIRLFVNAQFTEIRSTHRLAKTLDYNWPSVQDVNYIVEKSSSQFIYSATVMRFISGSSASPMVSLKRVRGLTPLASKSPYSQLDALYTYILSQADDQETLKDILPTQLLLTAVRDGIYLSGQSKIALKDLLQSVNKKYTKITLLSCLEDLTPLMRYDDTSDTLLFHHASFPDYLLDQPRSKDYFVDTAVHTNKIMPILWSNSEWHPESMLVFSLYALCRLQQLPPGIIDLLTSAVSSGLTRIPVSHSLHDAINKLYTLCTNEDNIISFRHFLHVYITKDNVHQYEENYWRLAATPFAGKYYQMAYILCHLEPDSNGLRELSPKTDFDRQELTIWLEELLDCICKKTHGEKKSQLVTRWTSWANSNGIACPTQASKTISNAPSNADNLFTE